MKQVSAHEWAFIFGFHQSYDLIIVQKFITTLCAINNFKSISNPCNLLSFSLCVLVVAVHTGNFTVFCYMHLFTKLPLLRGEITVPIF